MNTKKGVLLVLLATFAVSAKLEMIDNGKGPDWRKRVFAYIYQSKHWYDGESFSGPGSSLSSTSTIRLMLPAILRSVGARTMIDAGCGDFNWMKELVADLNLELYLGVDIVQSVIAENQKKYGNDHVVFMDLDVVEDPLPAVDVIMCRDVLAHLSYEDIHRALRNFKASGARFLLATSFSSIRENSLEMISGNFRSVNLQVSPFGFPEPLISVFELSSEDKMVLYGKRICLWRIADLPIS